MLGMLFFLLKYKLCPLWPKYFVQKAWDPVRNALYRLHKSIVVRRCLLEASVAGMQRGTYASTGGLEGRFNRKVALRRLHGTQNWAQDVWRWLRLLYRRSRQ